MCILLFIYLLPKRHAEAITALATISAGIKSAFLSGLHSTILIIPVIAATITPDGPYKLSIQPGTGSLSEPMTEIIKKAINVNYCLILLNFVLFFLLILYRLLNK